MENKFLKIDNKGQWQALLNKVLFKTFFHSLEWEAFLEENFKWLKFEHYNYQNSALLSLARIKILGKEKLISHPFCEYGGPLPLVEKIDGETFKKDLFEEFKNPFKISFHPKLLNYFQNLGIGESERETYFYENLENSQELWQRMDRNRHRAINKGSEQNFNIEKCKSIKDLKSLYALYVKNLKEHKALVYPFSFFAFFLKSPEAEIELVKKGNKLVGGNIFLFYNNIIHSFLCGFDNKYKRLGAHSLLLWSEIQKKEKQMFDFGATRKDSSIRDFKQRWGARVMPIYELKNYSGESKLRRSFLRDIWGYLPVGLIKVLSPYFIKYKL